MDLGLAADGASYCPAFALLDDAGDASLAAALNRSVTDGCPEARAAEADAQWWAVTAMAGVATDDAGRPAHGADSGVVDLGRGAGVLLVTDRAAACALTAGSWLGDATALVLSFDLDEVTAVEATTPRLRRRPRAITLELRGTSWGAVGFAILGRLDRHAGQVDAPLHRRADPSPLVARFNSAVAR